MIEQRRFEGRHFDQFVDGEALPTESRAALGQYTLERLMAYGLTHADATELRGRVSAGAPWSGAALEIAASQQKLINEKTTPAVRANLLYRASAMTRMAQAMMIEDTDERRTIFSDAAALFELASTLSADRRREAFSTSYGEILAWRFAASGNPVGAVIVIGGIEGWAMDFAELSLWLARSGMEVWAVDGPGQGESRFVHRHYLHDQWRTVYRDIIAAIADRAAGVPLGIVGSSVGGTLALEVAAVEPRISACCTNGGPLSGLTTLGQQEAKVPKKRMMCGPDASGAVADEIWADINAARSGPHVRCPVLIIHGQRDPLIADDEMREIFDSIASSDKAMVMFSDGDHCVYNHADDKHGAIAEWMADRLMQAALTSSKAA